MPRSSRRIVVCSRKPGTCSVLWEVIAPTDDLGRITKTEHTRAGIRRQTVNCRYIKKTSLENGLAENSSIQASADLSFTSLLQRLWENSEIPPRPKL